MLGAAAQLSRLRLGGLELLMRGLVGHHAALQENQAKKEAICNDASTLPCIERIPRRLIPTMAAKTDLSKKTGLPVSCLVV
mmetsp:Transcript_59179/g.117264  ORF Transcript_59179/g.117264 Transcript_59179/m.117264 type:complete len:81 (-) Transcript_59179:680-922(-)